MICMIKKKVRRSRTPLCGNKTYHAYRAYLVYHVPFSNASAPLAVRKLGLLGEFPKTDVYLLSPGYSDRGGIFYNNCSHGNRSGRAGINFLLLFEKGGRLAIRGPHRDFGKILLQNHWFVRRLCEKTLRFLIGALGYRLVAWGERATALTLSRSLPQMALFSIRLRMSLLRRCRR